MMICTWLNLLLERNFLKMNFKLFFISPSKSGLNLGLSTIIDKCFFLTVMLWHNPLKYFLFLTVDFVCVLCISTSKWVLCTLFAVEILFWHLHRSVNKSAKLIGMSSI